jgi:hypothetical protein
MSYATSCLHGRVNQTHGKQQSDEVKKMNNKYSHKATEQHQAKVSKPDPELAVLANYFPATPRGFSRRLHRKQAAEFLGVSLSWLDKGRHNGQGPFFITIGGRVLYDTRDLEAFIYDNRRSSTTEQY